MKVSCDVIRDLLPLYTDQAASADTVALVEEHLASCPACREELGRLGTALPAEPEGVEPLRRFKRRWAAEAGPHRRDGGSGDGGGGGGDLPDLLLGPAAWRRGMWRSLWNCNGQASLPGRIPEETGAGESWNRGTGAA